jgi:hypothetical protein
VNCRVGERIIASIGPEGPLVNHEILALTIRYVCGQWQSLLRNAVTAALHIESVGQLPP